MGERGTLAPGDVFAGYVIDRVLGVGGIGTVYLAKHPRLPKSVALKLLHPEMTRDDYVRSRFELEADHAARLEHPNIVAVYDRGREGDQLWIAMQYVDSTDTAEVLAGGPVDPARAVHIIGETAKALDYAHSKGVLHRDVKPANILLERDSQVRRGRVLLTDFGIAKALAETSHLTHTGMLVASLQYAAPEQFEGTILDARADVYSLGCTLFHLLTGQHPYPGSTLPELMHGHLTKPIPRPSLLRSGVPVGFDAVIAQAMAKDRDYRYPSCAALTSAAEHALRAERSAPTIPRIEYPQPTTQIRLHVQIPPDIRAAPTAQARPEPQPGHYPAPNLTRIRWQRSVPAVVIALLLSILGVAAVVWTTSRGTQTTQTQTQTSTTQAKSQSQTNLPFTGLNNPGGVAVNSAGDVFVADTSNDRVLKLAAGSNTQTELPFTGLNHPWAVAVNESGDVFITDAYNHRVLKLAAGSNTQTELSFTGLNFPIFVAVNSVGDVFVTEEYKNRVLELAAGSDIQTELPFTGLKNTKGVAVNSVGHVFVVDSANNRVLVMAAGSNTQTALTLTGLAFPVGVTVNSAGDVFVTDNHNRRVLELAAGSNTQIELPFTVLVNPKLVAVDSAGNVYVTDSDNVLELVAG